MVTVHSGGSSFGAMGGAAGAPARPRPARSFKPAPACTSPGGPPSDADDFDEFVSSDDDSTSSELWGLPFFWTDSGVGAEFLG